MHWVHPVLRGGRSPCSGGASDVVATHGNAQRQQRRGGKMGWSALVVLPEFGSRVLSASAVVAYVAVGAAAILGKSVTEATRNALAWESCPVTVGRNGNE
jgi:hypothetical protein